MSFQERRAWACLASTVVVYLPYFAYILSLYSRDALSVSSILTAFVPAVIVQIVLLTIVNAAIAILSGKKGVLKDERDFAIESKAYKIAYNVIISSCVVVILFVLLFAEAPGALSTRHSLDLAFISQYFLLCLVVAEATRYLTQVVCYRRGS